MMKSLLFVPTVVSALVAFGAVNWVYFKILRIALDKNLVDNPDARKLQKRPVPVMGGIAVFFGILAGVLAGIACQMSIGVGEYGRLMPAVCAMSVMVYVGTMDDILGLSAVSRLLIEILSVLGLVLANGMCIDSLHGLWGVDVMSWWIAVPLTVFAGVGVINAVNMIDGVNGLSSGLCMLCSGLFGVLFVSAGDVANAVLAFGTSAALAPFFIHNVFGQRSRMFIGDAGTMVMGMELTWLLIATLSSESLVTEVTGSMGAGVVAFALAVLCLPVADTLRVMTMRMMRGKSPFSPDKTHLHHVFIAVGVSHFITTMSELLIAVCIMGVWGLSVWMDFGPDMQLYMVIAAAVVLVWGTYGLLRYHAINNTEFLHWLTAFSVGTHLGRKEWWKRLTAWLDRPCGEEENGQKSLSEEELKNRLARKFEAAEPDNYKEQDRRRILQFIAGRAEALVDDIYRNSGANPLRVYTILFEEKMKGTVRVLKEDIWGAPEIVALVERNI